MFGLLYPFLNRIEAKERYKSIITEQRKQMFAEARRKDNETVEEDSVSAKETLATLFKLEKFAGARAARILLVQAGYRHPKALLYYLVARMVLPIVLLLLAFLFVQNIERPISDTFKLLIVFGGGLLGF